MLPLRAHGRNAGSCRALRRSTAMRHTRCRRSSRILPFQNDTRKMMKLATAILALAVALASHAAFGQTYPIKPIRMIVPFPPGGTSDVIGRTLGHKLSEAWGQNVII